MMKKIVAFDTETTGLLKPGACGVSEQPYIIEIFLLKFTEDAEVMDTLEMYLKPPIELPDIITKITGIRDKDLIGAKTFPEAYEEIADFMNGVDIFTAHNLSFDKNMLGNELMRIDKVLNFPWPKKDICTVKKSKHYEGYRLNLGKLYKYLFNKELLNAHRAKNDVMAQSECFIEMMKRGDIIL